MVGGWDSGGWVGLLAGLHARGGCCGRVLVGTGLATPCPKCIDRLTKHYCHLLGG